MEPTTRADLLTLDQVAEALDVSRRTVYRLVRHDKIPAVRISRTYYIHRDAYEAFVRGQA